MNYQRLIAEHDAIEAAASVVVGLAVRDEPRPLEVTTLLEVLADLLRRHLAHEDEAIYETILRARGGRNTELVQRLSVEFERLKESWEDYLYRWNGVHVAANWNGFVDETIDMLGKIRERVAFETLVLYSLAVHLDVITTG